MSLLCVLRGQGRTINTARRTTLAVAASAALALTGIAACGTVENLSAAQKIQKAADKLGEQKALTVEFGFDADPELLERVSDSEDPEDALSPKAAKAVSQLRVSVSVQASKPLSEAGDKDIKAVALSLGSGKGEELLDVRMVDKTLYLRADFPKLGETVDEPMPGADELPPEMGSFRDLFLGKWVKTDTGTLKDLAGGDDSGETGDPISPKTGRKLKTDLKSIVTRRVTFDDQGAKDGTQHIRAEAPARALVTDVVAALRGVADELPAGKLPSLPTKKDLKEVPNKKAGVDFALKDGTLSGITLDVTQFAEPGDGFEKGDKFDIVLRFADPGEIVAPAGAKALPKGKKGTIFGIPPEVLFGGTDEETAFDDGAISDDQFVVDTDGPGEATLQEEDDASDV
ncbi:hypothetical protein [Streptomyces sp. CA-253872]|uniref:hypothetical protein n=1 Tax=Streptomyces sp. CA-253872 TaxID=3240067 RepID=UPI003D908D89